MMMGDLGPAKPGCSLVPHKAEHSNIEGEGREQYLVYLGFTDSTLPVPELPNWQTAADEGIWTPELYREAECLGLLQLHSSQGHASFLPHRKPVWGAVF